MTKISHQKLLDQQRAQHAWKAVKHAKENLGNAAEGYGQLARSASSDIMTNGLGQTLAFWYSKSTKEKHHKQILKDVSSWVLLQVAPDKAEDSLLSWITDAAESNGYRRATTETMAYLNWLKRFSEAELL